MKILYIDTSTNYLYTGIIYDDKLLSEVKKKFDHDLSKYALYEISKMLEKCNLQPNDIDKIIVVNISGRGDKDVAAIARYRGVEIYE